MNIKEAKQQIKNAMTAYFACDEFGAFRIPLEEQRPVFLVGPPGIGKTAIMKQIAGEMNVGLISYSMTHHTRQSALGLPMIVRKEYEGRECAVTEYTMSEIISSVYDMIERAGAKRGILFLDEINCVSETLTPTMLQFLQYKTFGTHKVPEGWIVVTAGNPPEYNRSVREFDIVTYDRLKRIDLEPDYPAWREYALNIGIHPAVLTYLDAKKEHFYRITQDSDGKHFATARGWADLSNMIRLYEENAIPVDKQLVCQYLQDSEIAEGFAIYYDIFNKYKSDYQIESILKGAAPQEILERASKAPFDERLSLIGLLLDNINSEIKGVIEKEDVISALLASLREIKGGESVSSQLEKQSTSMERELRRGILTAEKRRVYEALISFLKKHEDSAFPEIKEEYDGLLAGMKEAAVKTAARLENVFAFAENCWEEGQELLLIVTELTANIAAARFISRYGCDAYMRHSDALMFRERSIEIIRQLTELEG